MDTVIRKDATRNVEVEKLDRSADLAIFFQPRRYLFTDCSSDNEGGLESSDDKSQCVECFGRSEVVEGTKNTLVIPNFFCTAHTSSLLGPRLIRVRALAMDHLGSTYLHDERLLRVIITSSGAFQGAAHSQQSLRRLVRRRAQLAWAQIRARRIRWRAGGIVSRLPGGAGVFGRRR